MPHDVLHTWSATRIAAAVASGDVSAVSVAEAVLARIEHLEPLLRAWAHLDPELFLKQATSVDQKVRTRQTLGALSGVPVAIKDIFNTVDMPTQMGSPIWSGFTPGNDARVVHYVRRADAVIPGKSVTAEFAVHAPGPTRNPHNPEYMPGTSSSGSAVAVAAGMVPIALGTQTAGSIIRPASYCGVYGMKPSFGLIPRTGMLKTTDSLDTVGFFARSVADLALFFEVVRVKGRDYPLSEAALNDRSRQEKPASDPWRVALIRGPKWREAEPYAREALTSFAERLSRQPGLVLDDLELPDSFRGAHDVHSAIYDRALAYYFKKEFAAHTLISPVMYEIISRGNATTLTDYQQALELQRALARDLDVLFVSKRIDVILTLSTGGEALKGLDAVDRPDNCLIWTLCGAPALNVPAFRGPTDLPFGVQLVARRFNDYRLLAFAGALQDGGLLAEAPVAAVPAT